MRTVPARMAAITACFVVTAVPAFTYMLYSDHKSVRYTPHVRVSEHAHRRQAQPQRQTQRRRQRQRQRQAQRQAQTQTHLKRYRALTDDEGHTRRHVVLDGARDVVGPGAARSPVKREHVHGTAGEALMNATQWHSIPRTVAVSRCLTGQRPVQ
jgi:hypothetical protein